MNAISSSFSVPCYFSEFVLTLDEFTLTRLLFLHVKVLSGSTMSFLAIIITLCGKICVEIRSTLKRKNYANYENLVSICATFFLNPELSLKIIFFHSAAVDISQHTNLVITVVLPLE